MVKVLHITVRADHGGGPKHVVQLLLGLGGKYECWVASPKVGNNVPFFETYSRGLFHLPARKFNIKSLRDLCKYVKNHKIDIVHSHGRGAGIYGRLLGFLTGIPIVHTHHGLYLEKYTGFVKCCMVWLERLLNRLTSRIIFVSHSEVKACMVAGAFDYRKSVVIPNCVSIPRDVVQPIDSRKFFRFIAVTRLEPEKGNQNLVEVMYELSRLTYRFRLIIVGDGPEREALQNMIMQQGLSDQIILVGSKDNVQDYLLSSDAFITASHGEGHSIALLEAMSHGLPIIASNVRGHVDMIQHNSNGILFNLANAKDAAQQIFRLMNDNDFAISLGQAGRTYVVNNFSLNVMLRLINSLYQEILHENRNCP